MKALHLVAHPRVAHGAESLNDNRLLDLLVARHENMPALSRLEMRSLVLVLGEASAELLESTMGRSVFEFDANREVWECGLERCSSDVLVSLYRPSPAPKVVTHERRLPLAAFIGSAR